MSTMVYVAEIGMFKLPEMNVSNGIYVSRVVRTHRDSQRDNESNVKRKARGRFYKAAEKVRAESNPGAKIRRRKLPWIKDNNVRKLLHGRYNISFSLVSSYITASGKFILSHLPVEIKRVLGIIPLLIFQLITNRYPLGDLTLT